MQLRLASSGDLAVTLLEAAYGLEVTVAAPDRVGLLSIVAGVLSLHRLAVRSATTLSVGDQAVQVWTVLPEFGSAPDSKALREDVRKALEGRLDVADRLRRREEAYPSLAQRSGRAVPRRAWTSSLGLPTRRPCWRCGPMTVPVCCT